MAGRAEVERVIPVLPARDVTEAVRFYVDRLGFELLFQDRELGPRYAAIRRGGVMLHLQFHDGSAAHAMLRLVIDDPDALFHEYAGQGVFHQGTELRDTPWGTREFAFWDLDGNGLTFMRDLVEWPPDAWRPP
jgi:catechol 2,3-dioxygenase-like lactoylglutathione lyase family enzyme